MIFIESSKTDQYRDGAWLFISSASSFITCLLKALNLYADMAGIDFKSDLPLFRGLNSVKTKTRMRKSKISYTRVKELVKEAFVDSIDLHQILLECIVSEQVVLALQRTMVILIGCLKDMGDGHQKTQKMDTLRIV